MNKTSVLGPVKKISYGVMIAIVIILICYVGLHNFDRHRSHDDKVIIDTLGNLRMYTQMISKDSSSLYTLMLEQQTVSDFQMKDDINKEISLTKNNLENVRKNFSQTLDSIHMKRLNYNSNSPSIHIDSRVMNKSEYLTEINIMWMKFDKDLKLLVNAVEANDKMQSAVEYIDSDNMRLLNLTNKLLDQLLDESDKMDRVTEYVEYSLILLLLILLSFYVYSFMRYIILPYNQLYKGLIDIGLYSYPVNHRLPTRKRVMPLVSEASNLFLKINNLISLIENINKNNSFMETLTYINETFSVFIPYNYIGIALISEDRTMLKASYGVSDGTVSGLPEKIMGANWPVKDTSLGKLFETGEARIINDLEEYCLGRPIKPYNRTILDAGIRASITLPLKVSGKPVGMIFFSSKSKNVYNHEHLNILKTLANSIAISLNQNIFASEMQYSSVLALANLSEARDENTGEHMERMAIYSRTIAQLLHDNEIYSEEVTLEYIEMIERFSPLHDIGKVGIADSILLKPGKLTVDEFNEMKKHTLFGAQVLQSADKNMQKKGKSLFGMGVEIARGHHEKWNGEGYPYGKEKEDIPLSARIVAIADVFDALTSKRPYKEAFSFEESIKIIEEGKGTHFDPKIVDIFLKNRKRIEMIYKKFQQNY